jgi:hypothetical protein
MGENAERVGIGSALRESTQEKAQNQPGRSEADHRGHKETLAAPKGGETEVGVELQPSCSDLSSNDPEPFGYFVRNLLRLIVGLWSA